MLESRVTENGFGGKKHRLEMSPIFNIFVNYLVFFVLISVSNFCAQFQFLYDFIFLIFQTDKFESYLYF